MKDIRIPPTMCPHCHQVVDAAMTASGLGVRPGCLSVCVYCGGFGMYNGELKLEKLGEREAANVANKDPGTWRKMREARRLIRLRNGVS